VRYKSTGGWVGDTPKERAAILAHQREFTRAVLDEGTLRVLVPLGNLALRSLCDAVDLEGPVPSSAPMATGHIYPAATRRGRSVLVLPVRHLSYASNDELARLGSAIRRAVSAA